MATIKIVAWKRLNKDGKYPLAIRITKNRKPSYIFTDHALPSLDMWDEKAQRVKKSHPNSARLNSLLLKKLTEAHDISLEMEGLKTDISARAIKKKIKPDNDGSFAAVAEQYLKDEYALGHYNVYSTDKIRLRRFQDFLGSPKTPFSEITVSLLERYQRHLRGEKNKNHTKSGLSKPLSERTVVNHLLVIRTIYNRAIKAGVADLKQYPFGDEGKIAIKFPKSQKIGLSDSEILALENHDLSDSPILNHARNIWLTAYYFAGMRITDVLLLKWSDFQNGRLYYTMSKNDEPCSLKVPNKILPILEQYRNDEQKHDLIFPELKFINTLDNTFLLQKRIAHAVNYQNKKMSKVMKLIGVHKKASSHVSRHSFAQRAEDMGVHPKVVQKLYRHESILTTMIYQSNFSHSKADEALDVVIGK